VRRESRFTPLVFITTCLSEAIQERCAASVALETKHGVT
jgi:hypothetical protein